MKAKIVRKIDNTIDVRLGAIDDLIKRRSEIVQKNNYSDEVSRLKLAIDSRRASFTRLNNDIAPVLKQLRDLGVTDKASELKKIMDLNSESIKLDESNLKNVQAIK